KGHCILEESVTASAHSDSAAGLPREVPKQGCGQTARRSGTGGVRGTGARLEFRPALPGDGGVGAALDAHRQLGGDQAVSPAADRNLDAAADPDAAMPPVAGDAAANPHREALTARRSPAAAVTRAY